ncbi:2-oxo-4-hydroxy-4-carboxy-5-ureidoimidazoline decarboxylase [Robbsia sp. KACC 23696]|uniref:2-oxo-4-hydroxy-4-carboxy-5-ureidoimidazoline decarboxylase n=1 Tax=Robbsia sp. KACC 23696 TaxID=3149231 RepID=UPI00325AA2EE
MDNDLSLSALNAAEPAAFVGLLSGLYEHTDWVAARVAARRPFASTAALLQALWRCVADAGDAEQRALIDAHPELGMFATLDVAAQTPLTAASAYEQQLAGLRDSLPEALRAALQDANRAYRARFGFPFVLAVRGSDGAGMPPEAILAALQRRLRNTVADEQAEALRQINRIAELRLNKRLGYVPTHGLNVLRWCEQLAHHSEEADALTCTYLTPTHRASAREILAWMHAAGLQAHIDAFGNVIGRYVSDVPGARTLLTGSHYDTVRNGGKYDGRIGILLPVSLIATLHARKRRLPFHLDIVAFAEEEGVRFRTAFLGSSVLTGNVPDELLTREDEAGVRLASLLAQSADDGEGGMDQPSGDVDAAWLQRVRENALRPASLIAFLEMHIEQGPVLFTEQIPLGVVTAISGSKRYLVRLTGLAGHAGAMPMALRRDAAAAAAEITLFVESRCSDVPTLVGTVGRLEVANGSVNVVPGHCLLSIDIRAGDDATRDAAVGDVMARIDTICTRRAITVEIEPVLASDTVPCAPALQARFAAALRDLGLPERRLPSGAGHDAVEMHRITDVGMLFIRCGNGGISHNPLETVTADDLDWAARAFEHVIDGLASDEWLRLGITPDA